MNNTYHLILPDDTYTSHEWTGRLDYACIPFVEIKRLLGLDKDDLVEHVNVLWQGKHCHMFVDEDGRAHRLPFNLRASRIYWNNMLSRAARNQLVYNDIAADPRVPTLDEAKLIDDMFHGYNIVGPALLWEGGME